MTHPSRPHRETLMTEHNAANDVPDADLAAQVRAACDAVGIPHGVEGLIRHHRGNAALAATMDALATRVTPPGATR